MDVVLFCQSNNKHFMVHVSAALPHLSSWCDMISGPNEALDTLTPDVAALLQLPLKQTVKSCSTSVLQKSSQTLMVFHIWVWPDLRLLQALINLIGCARSIHYQDLFCSTARLASFSHIFASLPRFSNNKEPLHLGQVFLSIMPHSDTTQS